MSYGEDKKIKSPMERKKIGEKLRQKRKSLGLTQKDVNDDITINQCNSNYITCARSLERLENGYLLTYGPYIKMFEYYEHLENMKGECDAQEK